MHGGGGDGFHKKKSKEELYANGECHLMTERILMYWDRSSVFLPDSVNDIQICFCRKGMIYMLFMSEDKGRTEV